MLLIFLSCSENKPKRNLQILAKVGDRIITVQDFQRRSEYTIRPDYCKGNLYLHKKIILNNLIAEKLLAIEAQGLSANLLSGSVDEFIRGRKEQSMRQLLYYNEGFLKSKINDKDTKRYYKMAGRTYSISYFSFPGGTFLESMRNALKDSIALEDIYAANFKNSIPIREVKWGEPNHMIIDQILFEKDVMKGQIEGPFALEDNSYFIFKVNGWVDQFQLSQKGQEDRMSDVINTLKEKESLSVYKNFIKKVMHEKSVKFNPEIFFPYAKSVSAQFFRSKEDKESAISNALFGEGEFLSLKDIEPMDKKYKDIDLFHINDKPWKVKDFEEELASHPLVFRKKKMNVKEFPRQFKLAIIDFIQDYYLTEKAYQLGLENAPEVLQSEVLWADSFLAFQATNFFLKGDVKIEDQHTILAPIIDKLQLKYDENIYINTNLFEDIKLSNIDMFVSQGNVPYPIVVPNFPSYTDDSLLDYGSKYE